MPSGKVKWFDAGKGFGFITGDDGTEVYLHASVLPEGITVRPGARVEYGVADGRRGPSALSVTVLDPVHSIVKAQRKRPEDMVVIVEDLIKLLDGVSNSLRRGKYPDAKAASKVAAVLRAVAGDLDA